MPVRAKETSKRQGSVAPGLGGGLDRRQFLIRAGMVGVSVAVLAVLLEACQRIGVAPTGTPGPQTPPASPTATATHEPPATPTPEPTSTPTPTYTPLPAPTMAPGATSVPPPTATPFATAVPRPTPSPTPRPLGTPTPTSPTPAATANATATASVTPSLTPTPVGGPRPPGDLVKIKHLLRRAGFGASQPELDKYASLGLEGTVNYLLDYEQVDDSAVEKRLSALALDLNLVPNLQRWSLLRMIYSARPLQEKMVLFWHGLLVSGSNKVGMLTPYMVQQDQLFRDNALGSYDVLLKSVSRDPAMLIYLDSRSNVKTAPNENFARELMELFTLGVGNYGETDVRESARAFTGWGLRQGGFAFVLGEHDYGPKSFLGRAGRFDGDDVVDIILQQPAAAEFISRKLFTFFAYDKPEPEVIAKLARTFKDGGYGIKAVVRQILQSPEFYSARAYRAKLKSPAELVAGAIRALGIETDGNPLRGVADGMGQVLFNPPNVAGWPGGAQWINSTTVMARVNFANSIAVARGPNPRFAPLDMAASRGATTMDAAMDFFAGLLVDGDFPREKRGAMLSYLGGGGITDEKLRNLVYFLLGSPEYQLA